jgi:aquaporin rerated protein, other eukaryote
LNPARSFGPDVVVHTFAGTHWIYWIGPALGSLVAVVFYRILKILEYETANPGQDFDEQEAEAFHGPSDGADDPEDASQVARPNVAAAPETSGSGGRTNSRTSGPTDRYALNGNHSTNNPQQSKFPPSSGMQNMTHNDMANQRGGLSLGTHNPSQQTSAHMPSERGYYRGPNVERGIV